MDIMNKSEYVCVGVSFFYSLFLSSHIYDISVRISFILPSLNSSYHLFLLRALFFLLKLPPSYYTVLSNPKMPRTVSAASNIISLYFSLSYFRRDSVACTMFSSIGTTLQRGL